MAAKGQIKNYLGYAFRILNKTDHKSLKIRATGNAIVKALILIELVKRRVGDLHQLNKIYSMEIVTYEESKIEGMDKIENKRRVTAMDTILSKEVLDEADPGYQKPEPKEENTGHSTTHSKDNKAKQNKEGGKSKGGKHHGKKLYNTPLEKDTKQDGDQQKDETKDGGGKQRRDRDNHGKHEQKKDKKKGGGKGDNKEEQAEGAGQQ